MIFAGRHGRLVIQPHGHLGSTDDTMHAMRRASPPRIAFVRRVLMAVPLLVAVACSESESPAPGPPTGPTIPSIGGTYASSSMWRFEQNRVSGGPQPPLTCAGGLTIANQLGESFSGTFFVSDPACGSAGGNVVAGTLRSDGTVTFGLTSGDGNFLTAAFGCTYVSGDTVMTGTLVGNDLQARSSTVMTCPNAGGELTLNVNLAGTK
jgi:hypothetical protein